MKYLISKVSKVKIKDICDFFLLIILLIPSMIYKRINRINKIWLISEDEYGANDNGFVFFQYMVKYHSEIHCYYVIRKDSPYYQKVKSVGDVIKWGSLKHWLYYLIAEKLISSQLGSSPNRHVVFSLEIIGLLKNKRVFLQHGILLNYYPSLEYKNNKLRLFICGAKPEFEFVKKTFNYPQGFVVYTGLARFDKLQEKTNNNNMILIMPTWRHWIIEKNKKVGEMFDFKKTNYYKFYNGLINSPKLIRFLKGNDLRIVFYLHRNMQKYVSYFNSSLQNIIIADRFDFDIQSLLKEASLMITDYSSVSMDFSYMMKPVIYYQFDENEFRQKHGKEGFFSYRKDGFGPVCYNEEQVVAEITKSFNDAWKMSEKYRDRVNDFYKIYDNNNCKRIFEEIIKI